MNHNNPIIKVSNLTKEFSFSFKNKDYSWFKNLFYPETKKVLAVSNISFTVNKGERVAFIGPNGAGKSTTIKMLSGILFPSSGSINILGLSLFKNRKKIAYRIGTVFGQRSQLLPNLPIIDSFEFFGVMYDMSDEEIKKRTSELIKLFDLESFIDQPVRKLSLGQRMRAEIATSLIHRPEIIFLDEPTIGLDVVAKKSLRDLLLKINEEENTTIFLTSHDVGDIETLCERTIIINNGTLIKDLPTTDLTKTFFNHKYIDIIPYDKFNDFPVLPEGMNYLLKSTNKITLSIDVNKNNIKKSLQEILNIFNVEDIDVYYADLESVIRDIYERNSNS